MNAFTKCGFKFVSVATVLYNGHKNPDFFFGHPTKNDLLTTTPSTNKKKWIHV